MRIAGILLAGGAGVRFGGGKLLARLTDGTTVGFRSATNLLSIVPEVIAVVRPGDDALARELAAAGAHVAACTDAHTGMGASLAHGVRKAGFADAYIVALADMPWINPATIREVVARLEQGDQLVIPRHQGNRGHPVGFAGAHYREQLHGLTGDSGAKVIIASATEICWLDVDDPGILRDVDLPGDLAPGDLAP